SIDVSCFDLYLLFFLSSPYFYFFLFFSFLMILRHPRSTLFPYTTLFRSFDRLDSGELELGIGTFGAVGERFGSAAVLEDRFVARSEEHTSELQSRGHLVCRLLLEKKKKNKLIFNIYIMKSCRAVREVLLM